MKVAKEEPLPSVATEGGGCDGRCEFQCGEVYCDVYAEITEGRRAAVDGRDGGTEKGRTVRRRQ